MKPEDLLLALNDVDDDLLPEASSSRKRIRFSGRKLLALVAAAVLAGSLVTTGFASTDGAGWFRSFFATESGQPLNESKNAYLSQSAAAFSQSQTYDGFTISLESALSDGVTTIIQFRVDVPEGTVLDAFSYSVTNQDFGLVSTEGEELSNSCSWGGYDENPEDNHFSLLYTIYNDWYEPDIDRIFDTTWKIPIAGIQAGYWENLYTKNARYWTETLVTGPWEFEVTIPENGNQELQFISEPVKTAVTMRHPIRMKGRDEDGHMIPEYYQEDIFITSLRLRALSFAIDFQFSDGKIGNADFDPFTIVMKDGSEILVGTHHSGLLGVVGFSAPGRSTFNLSSPIVLEDVDHILLPDGVPLYPTS